MRISPRSRPILDGAESTEWDSKTAVAWARHLGRTFGSSGALSALSYYEDIGWIDSEVRSRMIQYVQGLPAEDGQKATETGSSDDPSEEMLSGPLADFATPAFARHVKSLAFVAELAGDDLLTELSAAQLAVHTSSRQRERARAHDRPGTRPRDDEQ
ncbi:FlaD/FlaE family flagellar protein [Haloarchaeobius sp. DFWS5]|uniref:FlaD/FlaE family flagellar protein n=1 Tax=Haloarchaeobius sp. DFWS5 TaxID=3446114 RepID=UPI003EBDC1BC